MKYCLIVFSIHALLCISSCHRGAGESGDSTTFEEVIASGDSGDIVLSREQFETVGMKVGDPSPMMFSNAIKANGYIVSYPSGTAKIGTLVSGRIRKINHSMGDQIKKGEILFSLESTEIILLQQEYAEAFHHLYVLEADYNRLKELWEEKIVAEKEFLKAESEYRMMLSKTMGLKARLRINGIDPVAVENGDFVSFLSVTSPISGTITALDMVIGQNVEPQETVLEVINNQEMQIELQVFEKDLADIAIGQKVLFNTKDDQEKEFEATLSHLGKSIDPESRTIQCLAQIKSADQDIFMNNLYVEAMIYTCQRETMAVPEEAIIREGERNYVLILQEEKGNQMIFRKIPAHLGVTQQGYSEVLDTDLREVLLSGTYNLWTEQ